MTARDYLESVASLLLTFAKIMLCLTFVGYDRIVRLRGGGYREAHEPRPPARVLSRS